MKIEFQNSIRRLTFLCSLPDIKIAWINSCNHNKTFCKSASFSNQILEKLGDGFINGQQDFAVQKLPLQRKDYWMKKLCTIYPYSLNERTKNSNME